MCHVPSCALLTTFLQQRTPGPRGRSLVNSTTRPSDQDQGASPPSPEAGSWEGNLLNCHSQSESLPSGAVPLPRRSPRACGVTRANVGQQEGEKVLAGEKAVQG